MILTPTQWKVLRDNYALASFLQSDSRLEAEAKEVMEATGKLIDKAELVAEREELTAPF